MKMEFHRYSTIPVLAKDGSYLGTMTEGDLLWEIKNNLKMNLDYIEKVQVADIPMKTHYAPVDVNASMEDLMERVSNQNFVPVVDDYYSGMIVTLPLYADLLIIGGTSLEVGSAAQLAHMYHGKYMVIINKGKTKMEGKADLVFHDSIGKVMNSLDW